MKNEQVCSKCHLDELCDNNVHRVRNWFPKKLETQAHFAKPCN